MSENQVEKLKQWIGNSSSIVFFGGAGVSTESGIPDFRSVDGLYHMKYDYPPETILSHTFFLKQPEEFYKFYKDKMLRFDALPNITHRKLAILEKCGKLNAIITQNIDGLHQAAGSKYVYELHGSVHRNYCTRCHSFYDGHYMLHSKAIPKCRKCGGMIKPDVVLYEEGLNNDIIEQSVEAIENAEILIIGGTSLSVYPASGLIQYYRGNKLILINKSVTPFDGKADLLIQKGLGEVFEQIEV